MQYPSGVKPVGGVRNSGSAKPIGLVGRGSQQRLSVGLNSGQSRSRTQATPSATFFVLLLMCRCDATAASVLIRAAGAGVYNSKRLRLLLLFSSSFLASLQSNSEVSLLASPPFIHKSEPIGCWNMEAFISEVGKMVDVDFGAET